MQIVFLCYNSNINPHKKEPQISLKPFKSYNYIFIDYLTFPSASPTFRVWYPRTRIKSRFFHILQILFHRYYTKIICVVISKIYFLVILHKFRAIWVIVYHARLLPANLCGGVTLRNFIAFSGQSSSNVIGIFLACSNSFRSSSVNASSFFSSSVMLFIFTIINLSLKIHH